MANCENCCYYTPSDSIVTTLTLEEILESIPKVLDTYTLTKAYKVTETITYSTFDNFQ